MWGSPMKRQEVGNVHLTALGAGKVSCGRSDYGIWEFSSSGPPFPIGLFPPKVQICEMGAINGQYFIQQMANRHSCSQGPQNASEHVYDTLKLGD